MSSFGLLYSRYIAHFSFRVCPGEICFVGLPTPFRAGDILTVEVPVLLILCAFANRMVSVTGVLLELLDSVIEVLLIFGEFGCDTFSFRLYISSADFGQYIVRTHLPQEAQRSDFASKRVEGHLRRYVIS
ncbi:hypothetical protein OUZ56_016101 [Daphnia magna]|uniref:Uncharacterized protein n=1 Tax=Daphnia magna TaxID=35525 RepID=A0ABR0APN9_9CRUS|nr:hypothetical protein OUZ56_016101 [Daphnia magna]